MHPTITRIDLDDHAALRRGADEEARIGTNDSQETLAATKRASKLLISKLGFWDRFKGKGRKRVGWFQSLKAIATYSWLNILLVFIPVAWGMHAAKAAGYPCSHTILFMLCFLALVPLAKLLDYGGEQIALYCGKQLGDLIVITLNNAIEAALAVFLLFKGELRLLQATVIGVVLLRLLLIPGVAFITGGARIVEQELNPVTTSMNNTLLVVGSLSLLLPTAFFSALDRGDGVTQANGSMLGVVTDEMRGNILQISRGLSIILLVVYICSRFFVHLPPGDELEMHNRKNLPAELLHEIEHLEHEEAEMNPWACSIVLCVAVLLMAVTTEYLVESISAVEKNLNITEEWFGLILLPVVTFAADGILAIVYYIRLTLQRFLGKPSNPTTLAEARAIDLSIQFLMFWIPLLVIIGWCSQMPVSLLFDFFEITLLLAACFLVTYVTADCHTNWAEGSMLVAFYIMIALIAWYYPGQQEVHLMLSTTTVKEAVRAHKAHALLNSPGAAAAAAASGLPAHKTPEAAKLSPALEKLITEYLDKKLGVEKKAPAASDEDPIDELS